MTKKELVKRVIYLEAKVEYLTTQLDAKLSDIESTKTFLEKSKNTYLKEIKEFTRVYVWSYINESRLLLEDLKSKKQEIGGIYD